MQKETQRTTAAFIILLLAIAALSAVNGTSANRPNYWRALTERPFVRPFLVVATAATASVFSHFILYSRSLVASLSHTFALMSHASVHPVHRHLLTLSLFL